MRRDVQNQLMGHDGMFISSWALLLFTRLVTPVAPSSVTGTRFPTCPRSITAARTGSTSVQTQRRDNRGTEGHARPVDHAVLSRSV
jgi:hypothetical protein